MQPVTRIARMNKASPYAGLTIITTVVKHSLGYPPRHVRPGEVDQVAEVQSVRAAAHHPADAACNHLAVSVKDPVLTVLVSQQGAVPGPHPETLRGQFCAAFQLLPIC